MAKPLAALLARCRQVGLPIIYVNHVHREHGCDKGTLAARFPGIGEGRVLSRRHVRVSRSGKS